ncbi:hypothetical protein L873DRAFT_112514 [Choiromyces venosus 120613-1]|uniref:Uncharacterized protein n=1 Tax=Choiromyces venosus 120613-1 TaxID=1336337 RepID=A0A3N4J4H5_9PEZI|nr:hypothetical protein L873DRAFT_112514 [Choiromyces venosus 120613-1]
MDNLLTHLENAKFLYSDTSIYSIHLLTSIDHAWSVLDKYDHILIYPRLHPILYNLTYNQILL